jgi:hypothetical protein
MEIESLALITVKMDPNNIKIPRDKLPGNVDLLMKSLKINVDVEELPDELSEEEVTVIDINDNVVTVKVPKVKSCPYGCLGCQKLKETCEQISNDLV